MSTSILTVHTEPIHPLSKSEDDFVKVPNLSINESAAPPHHFASIPSEDFFKEAPHSSSALGDAGHGSHRSHASASPTHIRHSSHSTVTDQSHVIRPHNTGHRRTSNHSHHIHQTTPLTIPSPGEITPPGTVSAPPPQKRTVTSHSTVGTISLQNLSHDQRQAIHEEPLWTNEDLNEDDRRKAASWAVAATGTDKKTDLPEDVLRNGFKIKKFYRWIPLEIAVDLHHNRFTFSYPDSFLDMISKKTIAHRVEINDVRSEKPQSHKHPFPEEIHGNRFHFSKRRLNLIKAHGRGKYHIMAPTKEYRDKFLDMVFTMHHPTSSTSL